MNETKEVREVARKLLDNWGRWCYINLDKLLQIPEQPIFRMYVAPRGEKRKPSKPVIDRDAKKADAAIYHIRLKECPFDELPKGFFSLHELIVLHWAHGFKVPELCEHYGVKKSAMYERINRAVDEFIGEYQNIVRDERKINKNNSEKG